jgi:tetratricopeptide (TPR) repeat protein
MRARPERSFEAATRHLFRHVWNPGELRRNPIVGGWFEDEPCADTASSRTDALIAEEIRSAVRRHADECFREDAAMEPQIALRRNAIIVDGDLGRMPSTRLAKRLGVSTRQYRRDQREIRRQIAVLLRARLPETLRSAAPARDVTRDPLNRAAVLAGLGMPNEALAHIEDVVRTADHDEIIVSALCLRSAIFSRHLGDQIGARETLLAAQALCLRLASESYARVAAEAEVGLSFANLDAAFGRLAGALERLRVARELLAGAAEPDSRTPWLVARAASFHAYVSHLAGDDRSAAESLQISLQEYRAATEVLSQDRAEFLIQTAIVLKAFGHLSEASRYLREAASIAQQNGLAVQRLLAELIFGNVALACGEERTSETLLSATCDEAERLGHTAIYSAAQLYLARCHLRRQSPKPARVLFNVEATLRFCPPGGPHWIDGKVTESLAKLLLGDLAAADESARQADEAAASGGCLVLRCSTLREAARVAHAQRRAGDAKDLITRAIDLAYSQRQMEQAAQAHEVAAMITRDGNHRMEAMALRRHSQRVDTRPPNRP